MPYIKSIPGARLLLISSLLMAGAGAQAGDLPELPKAVKDPLFKPLDNKPELSDDPSGKWEGSFGLGFTLRQGNSNTTEGSVTLDAVRNMHSSRLLANALMVRSSEKGERSSDSGNADFRGERELSEKTFGFAGVGMERDSLQDMSLRGSLNSGVGVRWLNSESTVLNLHAGVAYSMERYKTGNDEHGFEPLLGSEWRYELSPTSRITHRLVVYPDSVGGGTRYAMQGELTTRINSHFGLQLAMLQKYREKVRDENSHTDTVIFTGITAGF
ncbi:MAG: putative salt-induced outer membrane protein [Proteobacteria bacterium]|nr:putative salt-induced outer membrane protein [Pseudomonadota bacterium]